MEKEDISKIEQEALQRISRVSRAAELEGLRIEYLGRKQGKITGLLRAIKDLSEKEKRTVAPLIQRAKVRIDSALAEKEKSEPGGKDRVDVTLPGKRLEKGHLHPLTRTEDEIRKIFSSFNFNVIEGPEVETEYYNFDALNIPESHPAREMWDTFWLKQTAKGKEKGERKLLRTHTSPMQVRYMESHQPPFQIIVPGRCFRYEATDASHEINFYQFEGLMVGREVSLANLKFVIEEFLKKFFRGKKIEFRYRPSYFPFVEPGLEIDIRLAGGKWMELLGAGMVHPHVFEAAHYNPRDWQGFAFGVGIDRLAMTKYGIPDIRMLYSGDLRLVRQF
jgi:phenylalanyl-tRNA synthetase alpha chain